MAVLASTLQLAEPIPEFLTHRDYTYLQCFGIETIARCPTSISNTSVSFDLPVKLLTQQRRTLANQSLAAVVNTAKRRVEGMLHTQRKTQLGVTGRADDLSKPLSVSRALNASIISACVQAVFARLTLNGTFIVLMRHEDKIKL